MNNYKINRKTSVLAGEYEHIKGKGNRFSSTNQPANRGRKPKLYTIAKKTYGISFEEFKEVVNYLVQCPRKELNEIAYKEDTPIWMLNVCRALYKDTGKGVINTLRELITLMWGKEMASKFDITTNGKELITAPSMNIQVVTNDPKLLELQEKSVNLKEGNDD